VAENLIHSSIYPKKLVFKPGKESVYFEVSVRNDSNDYASFQVVVEADYDRAKQQSDWYRISPEVSTFNPPGDLTKFKVELTNSPVPGFVGLMQLRVIVSSVELPDKDVLLLPVNIEQGSLQVPLDLTLPVKEFHKSPGSVIEIPVKIRNLGQIPTNVHLEFLGVEKEWLRDGSDRNFKLEAGEETSKIFTCQLPDSIDTEAQNYPFVIQADHSNGLSSSKNGNIEVLSIGYVDFGCDPKELTIPERFSFAFWRSDPVTYILKAENASNMVQELFIEIEKQSEREDNGVFEVVELQQEEETENVVGVIESIELRPKELERIALRANAKRPWIGKAKRLVREVNAVWSGRDRIDTRNENQTIILNVKPIFPKWLLIQGGILFFLLLYFLIFLNPSNHRHKDAVNSVQFNGVGKNVISGSTDQTIINWDSKGFLFNARRPKIETIEGMGKMVRVVRYKPVDNNVIGVGLENGEIQLWDLLSPSKSPLASFQNDPDDRVFDLVFTKDSRFLFSGHGSGKVLLWDITNDLRGLNDPNKKPQGTQQFDFTVFGLELIGNDQTGLAIAGRYNQFIVWNLANGKVLPVDYGLQGGQDDYIETLDVSELNPYLGVTGDTQGYITLWDLSSCSRLDEGMCGKVIERWQDGHNQQPVRSVALDPKGCYLVSGGDDGNTKLWYLTDKGNKNPSEKQGEIIHKSNQQKKFNTVDVITVKDNIYIVSGGEDRQVRFSQRKRKSGCDNP
jgi:WD40 repeat protein